MGRVRIYELAKEIGMGSKALASKMIEDGYDVKGPSSTVDDETAAKIRATFLKGTGAGLGEKKGGSAPSGAGVIRRRPTTIIRRRPQDEPEEPEGIHATEAGITAPQDTVSIPDDIAGITPPPLEAQEDDVVVVEELSPLTQSEVELANEPAEKEISASPREPLTD